jgi:hypothetical protein
MSLCYTIKQEGEGKFEHQLIRAMSEGARPPLFVRDVY